MYRKIAAAGMMLGIAVAAFGQKPESLPSFEVASIKPAAPMQSGRMMIGVSGGPGTPDTSQMTFTNVSLNDLIQNGWNVKGYQVSGPGWIDTTRFDIAARVPPGTTKEQSRLMIQNLLAERFGLVVHHSTKEASIYAMLVAKNGPKLKESAPNPDGSAAAAPVPAGVKGGPGPGRIMMTMVPGGRMKMIANGANISRFIDVLSNQVDRPIVDMTGLTGTYDIALEFAPDAGAMQAKMAAMGVALPPGAEGGHGPGADAGDAATIFTALTEQLGLRLEARKGPLDLLVVDSAQKTPTEN